MTVKRFTTEVPITFDNGDDIVIHRKFQYDTYAASAEDAEEMSRMFVQDFAKKLARNTSSLINDQFYDCEIVPTIDDSITVWETHKHHDNLDSDEDLPLVYREV